MFHTYITRVHLQGYKNIRNTEVIFQNGLNIIIGPNGAGKTNFMWLLANIEKDETSKKRIAADIDFVSNENNKETSGNLTITHDFNAGQTSILKIKNFKNTSYTSLPIYFIPYEIPKIVETFTLIKTIFIEKTPYYYSTDINNDIFKALIKNVGQNCIANKRLFTINDLNIPTNYLKYIKRFSPLEDIKPDIQKETFSIVETAESIKIQGFQYLFKISDEWFSWADLSDGTKRIVWIILNMALRNQDIILLEEPEIGVHPHQFSDLMQFLKEEANEKQIIMTTHNSKALDIFDVDDLDRISIVKYDAIAQTTLINRLSTEMQTFIKKYMEDIGFLSNYWVNIGIEEENV